MYTGDQLGEGLKSLAYAVTFRAEDKTLTSEDSEAIRKRIVDAAAKLARNCVPDTSSPSK